MSDTQTEPMQVWADWVCPFCYMNWAAYQQAEAVPQVVWRAYELRPGGVLPPPEVAEMIAQRWPAVQEKGRAFGAEIRSYHFGVDSRPAHRAYKLVRELAPERAAAFGTALYEAYFRDDLDIGDSAVLRTLAERIGLSDARLGERLAVGRGLHAVLADEAEARSLGITSIPALLQPDGTRAQGPRLPDEWAALAGEVAS